MARMAQLVGAFVPYTNRLWVQFSVGAHTGVVGSVPCWGTCRRQPTDTSLSFLSPPPSFPVLSLSFFLSKSNKQVSSGGKVQADSVVWRNIQSFSALTPQGTHWECKKCSTCDFSAQGGPVETQCPKFLLKADYVGTVLAALENQTSRRKAGLQNSSQSLHR